MSGNGNQVPLAPNQRGPGAYSRAPTPHSESNLMNLSYNIMPVSQGGECYHPSGGSGTTYMQAGTQGASQNIAQNALRVPPAAQQPSATQQQQEMSKGNMSSHNFGASQNQSSQARSQFQNYPFRTTQHTTRPSPHPRQQQQAGYIQSATTTGPTQTVMYGPPLMFPQPHMGMPQQYQQQRPQGFYQTNMTLVPQPLNYSAYPNPNQSHQSYYYQSNTQQLPAPSLTATPQAGVRSAKKRPLHRLAIIDPVTKVDILSDFPTADSQNTSGESSERQTPQTEINVIAEEFSRMVNEAANQPTPTDNLVKSIFLPNKVDITPLVLNQSNSLKQQVNAINSINNNTIVKSDSIPHMDTNHLGPDVATEPSLTPIVSAISDSPVIVPKLCPAVFKIQKISEPNVQTLAIDTSKNVQAKQHKPSKAKPVVPQVDEEEVAVEEVAAPVQVPQPQRIKKQSSDTRSNRRDSSPLVAEEKESFEVAAKVNGPTTVAVPSSVDIIHEVTDLPIEILTPEPLDDIPLSAISETEPIVHIEAIINNIDLAVVEEAVAPKLAVVPDLSLELTTVRAKSELPTLVESEAEVTGASQAQAKLNQSLASCSKNNQVGSKMKDKTVKSKKMDPDAANKNSTDSENNNLNNKENLSKSGKVSKSSKSLDKKSHSKSPDSEIAEVVETNDNIEVETEDSTNDQDENVLSKSDENLNDVELLPPLPEKSPVPKYKYNEDQWSPSNTNGKKYYDIGFLMQLKDDPQSRKKPDNIHLLEVVMKPKGQEGGSLSFTSISRPNSESFLPPFAKTSGTTRGASREANKKSTPQVGKSNVRGTGSTSGGGSSKPVIRVSLSLREDVKLNETENAWKPRTTRGITTKGTTNLTEEEKTQDLYKKFRGILNKLTPQKFDTLLERVKSLEIDTEDRLKGVIDLVFEKAIEEPSFSEAYAQMCNKLSKLMVPSDNASDQYVNFRALIISKCQNQFQMNQVQEAILKLEKELAESTDAGRKKELQLIINEENRKMRMRSVGNVRFIGELYKLKMLTSKIMLYCMTYLIEKFEEEKLECLCKLLTTIGEQVESEVKPQLDKIFKSMQEIVDRKSNKISSRVRFMLQDVIALRKRRWTVKSVNEAKPKMMDQIQKEAEQQQRQIELMNSPSMNSSFRRDDGNRGKRNDGRRQGSGNSFMDNNWQVTTNTRAKTAVDTSKLKAASNTNKDLSSIKLGPPQNSGWNHGSGTKSTNQNVSNSLITLPATTNNMYSVLETVSADPSILKGKENNPGYRSKGASIERSTFNSRDYNSDSGSRSSSMGVPGLTPAARTTVATAVPLTTAETPEPSIAPASVEPLTDMQRKTLKSIVELCLINPDDNEFASEIKTRFSAEFHSAVVTEIINVALEKPAKVIAVISKSLLHLVSTNTISADNFVQGLYEIFEFSPDLYIDVPMLYDYLAMFVAPHFVNKHINFVQLLKVSEKVISENLGHLFLKALIKELKSNMGPSFVKSKWQESELNLNQWMKEEQVSKFVEENKFEFLEGGAAAPVEEMKKELSMPEVQAKILHLMNTDQSCDCIKGWVEDNLGKSSSEDWFMRSLIQAICEYALYGPEGRGVLRFSVERMTKYIQLINEFGETKQARESNCLIGIQQLVHRLQHPQGVTLEIFQYLSDRYIISVEGFLAWENSESEPEGKGVIKMALTSFFTDIKEADNEDSCSED